jgi:hypothetical protein
MMTRDLTETGKYSLEPFVVPKVCRYHDLEEETHER